MTINQVDLATVKSWGVIELDEDDALIENIIMPAALSRVLNYTGLTLEECGEREDITMAYLALCVFLYENRSMNVLNDRQNAVIASFLDSHSVNLL